MNDSKTKQYPADIEKILEEHGKAIDSEFRRVLQKYGIDAGRSRYSGSWKCTVEAATVPCSFLHWVFDPMPGTHGP